MHRFAGLWRRPAWRVASVAALFALLLGIAAGWPVLHALDTTHAAASSTCQINSAKGDIQHVINVQFDNTHFTRDNPNVPSDLEQMPHLLNFIEGNGTLLSNHHTPLISHTATDILTSLTGVYGDRHGVPVSNSFRYFNPNGTSSPGVSFAYWTAPLFDPSTSTATDTKYNMLTADGKNAPAPWVPFTRAGCNVGAVATANTILENIGIDIPTVFGANSDQAAEVKANPAQATADFVGIGIHCAKGADLCASAKGGLADALPDEPGGYSGYQALFGHKYVAPQISPNGPVTDLNGNVIQDATGHVGFPGFDGMSASVSLGYVAAMQEHGVPVTYAYISDAHDNHQGQGAYGPGSAGYVAALKSYDDAFGKFFDRLASDGINQNNTLFVFTADEGDHFVGGPPSPANCDGVTVPCTYSQIGELNANLAGLLATQQGITTPFTVHSDDAPTVYITGNPASTATTTRAFERATGNLTAVNPMTGNTDQLTTYLADPVEMKLLHMVTGDPARTPTFTMFGNPDYFFFAGARNCNAPCVVQQPGFAWNHGDVQSEITTTWLGIVGPGVRHDGVNGTIWSDHTDIRPTVLSLLGLKDDYVSDGRVLFEALYDWAVPQTVRAHSETLQRLAETYKQINAPIGELSLASLQASTTALKSNAAGDATYTQVEGQLATLTSQRDTLAAQMSALLNDAEFNGKAIDEQQAKSLIDQGQALLAQANALNG
ncbi:MAG: sulfatase-like hydrolase/transferase [Ktedonobacterales bacterium]